MNILMNFQDNEEKEFQLFEDEGVYTIATEAVDVSDWGAGCCWCAEFEKLSDATFAIHQIVQNSEINKGKVDLDWLVKTFGKGTC